MKINKIVITVCLAISLVLSIFTNVHAADMSGTVTLSLDSSSSYKVGDTITINVDLSVSGFDGVITFLADVEYDKEVLEYTDVITPKGWSVVNSDGNVYIEKNGLKDSVGRMCQLTFKVLKGSPETAVKLLHIDASGISGAVYYLDKNVNEPSISFKTEALPTTPTEPDTPTEPTPDTPTTPTQPDTPAEPTPDTPTMPTEPDTPTEPTPTTPGNTGNTGNTGSTGSSNNKGTTTSTNKTTTTNKKTTTAPGKIPQTGTMEIGMILIAIGADISIIMLIRYRKANRRINR